MKHEIMAGLCNLALGWSSLAGISFPLGLLLTHTSAHTHKCTYIKNTNKYIANNYTCCIPLIFARPFQSVHLSLGNIAHTFLYASFYPLILYTVLHWLLLHSTKKNAPFPSSSACQSLTDKSIVSVIKKATCFYRLGHNRRFSSPSAVLVCSKL